MRSKKVWASWVSDGYLRHRVQGQLLQDQHRCAGDNVATALVGARMELGGPTTFGATVRERHGTVIEIGARSPTWRCAMGRTTTLLFLTNGFRRRSDVHKGMAKKSARHPPTPPYTITLMP